jgi:hypothetical protein
LLKFLAAQRSGRVFDLLAAQRLGIVFLDARKQLRRRYTFYVR